MRIKSVLAALMMGVVMLGTAACGQQNGCYDDGERVSCNQGDDDDDDDEDGWEDDD